MYSPCNGERNRWRSGPAAPLRTGTESGTHQPQQVIARMIILPWSSQVLQKCQYSTSNACSIAATQRATLWKPHKTPFHSGGAPSPAGSHAGHGTDTGGNAGTLVWLTRRPRCTPQSAWHCPYPVDKKGTGRRAVMQQRAPLLLCCFPGRMTLVCPRSERCVAASTGANTADASLPTQAM